MNLSKSLIETSSLRARIVCALALAGVVLASIYIPEILKGGFFLGLLSIEGFFWITMSRSEESRQRRSELKAIEIEIEVQEELRRLRDERAMAESTEGTE